MDALDDVLPGVAAQLPRVRLGNWPTPIEPLPCGGRAAVYVKREDQSSEIYGGNKIRCLETTFGRCRIQGARRVWALGAWGSNQAVAITLHGPRADFETGALLFPQPATPAAAENLMATVGAVDVLRLQRALVQFPWSYGRLWLGRRAEKDALIPPGAANPVGALGHLSAALEVALAVKAGTVPVPRHVVLPVGSTCTTAGLLLGFALVTRMGLGFEEMPTIHAVRVTPWPITAAFRIRRLALATAHRLEALGGPDLTGERDWLGALKVVGGYLGWGYGRVTSSGRAAVDRFSAAHGPKLDTTYSGKAAAGLLDIVEQVDGSVLFWSTKSSAPMPALVPGRLDTLPMGVRRWLERSGAPNALSAKETGEPGP